MAHKKENIKPEIPLDVQQTTKLPEKKKVVPKKTTPPAKKGS